jgi:hypothetical protein
MSCKGTCSRARLPLCLSGKDLDCDGSIWLRSYCCLSQYVQVFTCQAHPACRSSYNIDQLSPRRRPRGRSLIGGIDIRRRRSLRIFHSLHINNHRIHQPKCRAVSAPLDSLTWYSMRTLCLLRISLTMAVWNACRLSTPPNPHTRPGAPSLS